MNTGVHYFNSLDEYCDGLQISDWNHGCVESQREAEFENRCPEKTWEPAAVQKKLDTAASTLVCTVDSAKDADETFAQTSASQRDIQGTTGQTLSIAHQGDYYVFVKQEIRADKLKVHGWITKGDEQIFENTSKIFNTGSNEVFEMKYEQLRVNCKIRSNAVQPAKQVNPKLELKKTI